MNVELQEHFDQRRYDRKNILPQVCTLLLNQITTNEKDEKNCCQKYNSFDFW